MEIGKNTVFYEEKSGFSGVKKVAEHVKKDMELVTGYYPQVYSPGADHCDCIIYGTIDNSDILKKLEDEGLIDGQKIRGKREVYLFQVFDNIPGFPGEVLVIAGSDKRGTIYALYHLSELLGVSPLVNWNHVRPARKEKVILTSSDNMISKEPSVKYRGFFINDEWPAFGTWASTHFGGINASCYEKVFELLLRLKGNYLWPAMWASDFNLDGPGLKSAELADEYGIVMSTSHHEPCMRSGREYSMVRGKDSIYGDAWDFRKNPQGITQFWKDGLLRNKSFENVITLGMRGENDTALLNKEASLEENISLLRQVLKTQNQLIRDNIHPDVMSVPRQMVLFTEVEEFFYGNKKTPGLINDTELEGVTLILSDNNAGYARTLPDAEMRSHKGGYGMYYHMDMHGGPYAFEWIGSTYLPKLWEQMTMAYDYGVREIWVANIGDIGTQEYGLSFFLDLAYDIERYRGQDASVTKIYTEKWLSRQFGDVFSREEISRLSSVMMDYTGLLAKRKHEVMNDKVFHPVHFGEAGEILETAERILKLCGELKEKCPDQKMAAFISLLYYPACGTANLMKMWILAGRNAFYASQNRVEANELAGQIAQCIQKDSDLTEEYHTTGDGMFFGFGLSEHIGFTNWNDEDNKYPQMIRIHPANRPRMIVSRVNDTQYVCGNPWTEQPPIWRDAVRQDVEDIFFDVACGSREPIEFTIDTEDSWLHFSHMSGKVEKNQRVHLHIDKTRFTGTVKGKFRIKNEGYSEAVIFVEARNELPDTNHEVFIENDGYICIDASHFQRKNDVAKGSFYTLKPYGRTGSAVKVYPTTADFRYDAERPYTEYHFLTEKSGTYHVRFYLSATTPVTREATQLIGYSVNDGDIQVRNTVKKPEEPFFCSEQWECEAYEQIKLFECTIDCRKGINVFRFYGMSPAMILERLLFWQEGTDLPDSYLGPRESYRYKPDTASENTPSVCETCGKN